MSTDSHIGEFIAEKIEGILDQIRPKFSAIVNDNRSNVKKVCDIIEKKYSNIKNVRCILHCINLYLSIMF